MGFLDDMFGKGFEFDNPNKAFGQQMPGAYRQYFADIQKQLGDALAKKEGMDDLRRKYWSQIWDMRKAGIEQALERVQSRPSVSEGVISQGQVELDANLDKIRERSQSDAIRRGLGSSTVDMTRARGPQNEATRGFATWAAGLRADEQRQKQADVRVLQDQLSSLPAARAGDYMDFLNQYGGSTFDPAAYMQMRQTQMGTTPWAFMTQKVGDKVSGERGLLDTFGGGFLGAGGAGMMGGLMGGGGGGGLGGMLGGMI